MNKIRLLSKRWVYPSTINLYLSVDCDTLKLIAVLNIQFMKQFSCLVLTASIDHASRDFTMLLFVAWKFTTFDYVIYFSALFVCSVAENVKFLNLAAEWISISLVSIALNIQLWLQLSNSHSVIIQWLRKNRSVYLTPID